MAVHCLIINLMTDYTCKSDHEYLLTGKQLRKAARRGITLSSSEIRIIIILVCWLTFNKLLFVNIYQQKVGTKAICWVDITLPNKLIGECFTTLDFYFPGSANIIGC